MVLVCEGSRLLFLGLDLRNGSEEPDMELMVIVFGGWRLCSSCQHPFCLFRLLCCLLSRSSPSFPSSFPLTHRRIRSLVLLFFFVSDFLFPSVIHHHLAAVADAVVVVTGELAPSNDGLSASLAPNLRHAKTFILVLLVSLSFLLMLFLSDQVIQDGARDGVYWVLPTLC